MISIAITVFIEKALVLALEESQRYNERLVQNVIYITTKYKPKTLYDIYENYFHRKFTKLNYKIY